MAKIVLGPVWVAVKVMGKCTVTLDPFRDCVAVARFTEHWLLLTTGLAPMIPPG